MDNSRFVVDHIRQTTAKPFDEVRADFERQLGRFDASEYQALAAGENAETARARIEAMAGPSGFMLFGTIDHGALLRIAGHPRKAVQYVVGNPLYAIEMTRHALGAALYAPLRVLIYEDDNGKTHIEYDRPSSLFGQFGDTWVDETAASLDRKLADLASEATR
jgi:uncharacterized protein (DUF302 family)